MPGIGSAHSVVPHHPTSLDPAVEVELLREQVAIDVPQVDWLISSCAQVRMGLTYGRSCDG